MGSLAAQPEPADDGAVAVVVVAHQVRKQASTLSDELEKSASRVVVLGKAAQMLGQSTDTLGQQSDLDFRRSGIGLMEPEFFYYVFFRFGLKCQLPLNLLVSCILRLI